MKIIWNRKSQGYGTGETVSLAKKKAAHAIANGWARPLDVAPQKPEKPEDPPSEEAPAE